MQFDKKMKEKEEKEETRKRIEMKLNMIPEGKR